MVLNIKFRRGRQSSRAIRAQAGSAGGRARGARRRRIDSAAPSVGVRRAPRCAERPSRRRAGVAPPRGPRPATALVHRISRRRRQTRTTSFRYLTSHPRPIPAAKLRSISTRSHRTLKYFSEFSKIIIEKFTFKVLI